MLKVLGRVQIDVGQRHIRLEVRIPRGRVAHPSRQLSVALPVQTTQQLGDHAVKPPAHPWISEQPWPGNRSEVVDDMERSGRGFERARERTAEAIGQSAEDPYEKQKPDDDQIAEEHVEQ